MSNNKTRILLAFSTALLVAIVALPVSAGLFRWTRLGRLIPQTGFEPAVSVLVGDPTSQNMLYAATLRSTDNTNLIFSSNDGGATWNPASGGLPTNLPQNTGVNDLVIRPDAPNTMVAGLFEAGVWLSTNGGQNWINATNGSVAGNDTVRALAVDPAQPSTVYALTGAGVHVSIDGGMWESRSNGLPAASATLFNDLAADPVDSGTLYVAATPQGVFRSTNAGQSWESVNQGLPAGDLNVRGIAASPVSGRLLISIVGQGLWRSDDQGDSWTRSDSGVTYNSTLQGNVGIPTFSYSEADFAYVYNNDGIFISFDGGENWSLFNDGFSGAETVTTMAFHPAAVNTAYAGTSVAGAWSLTFVPGGRYFVPMVIR